MSEQHLVQWVNSEIRSLGFSDISCKTIEEITSRGLLQIILANISNDHFSASLAFSDVHPAIIRYFKEKCKKYMKLKLKNDRSERNVIALTIYVCLHFEVHQDSYVKRIMKMNEQAQKCIMNLLNDLENYFESLDEWPGLINALTDYEQEIARQAALLSQFRQDMRMQGQMLRSISQELTETQAQRDSLIMEKRKILSRFRLSSMAEYEQFCDKLISENENIFCKYEKKADKTQALEEQVKLMVKSLQDRDDVIVELTQQIEDFQLKHEITLKELEAHQTSNLSRSSNCMCETLSKRFDSTRDETIQSAISDARRISSCLNRNILNEIQSSGFSNKNDAKLFNFCSTNQDIFRITKNSLTLCEKLELAQQQNEQLKLKLIEMEEEFEDLQKTEKKLLIQLRKGRSIFDKFWKGYQKRISKVAHSNSSSQGSFEKCLDSSSLCQASSSVGKQQSSQCGQKSSSAKND